MSIKEEKKKFAKIFIIKCSHKSEKKYLEVGEVKQKERDKYEN